MKKPTSMRLPRRIYWKIILPTKVKEAMRKSMRAYRINTRRSASRRLLLLAAALVILIIGGIFLARRAYTEGLKPVSSSQQAQVVTIASGSNTTQIAKQLADKHLI